VTKTVFINHTVIICAALSDAADRDHAARIYSRAIYNERVNDWGINWVEVNQTIIHRWSESGLRYIKDMAWKLEGAGMTTGRMGVKEWHELQAGLAKHGASMSLTLEADRIDTATFGVARPYMPGLLNTRMELTIEADQRLMDIILEGLTQILEEELD
jgi:hypothetical protein